MRRVFHHHKKGVTCTVNDQVTESQLEKGIDPIILKFKRVVDAVASFPAWPYFIYINIKINVMDKY